MHAIARVLDALPKRLVAKLDRDWTALTAFYNFPGRALAPAAHLERNRVLLRHRQAAPRHEGAGSTKAALAMAYKLLDTAQQRWRRFGHELAADVLNDVSFKDGERVTDDENTTTDDRVAA